MRFLAQGVKQTWPQGASALGFSNIDIETVESGEEWAELYSQAIWLERWRNKNKAELIARLFGDGKRR